MSFDRVCLFNIQKFSLHDGPGIRTALFFKGCPLRCKWCSNPESFEMGVQAKREENLAGKWYTYADVLRICLADRDFYEQSGGGITLTGGEVLSQAQAATALLKLFKEEGIHTAIETSGFAPAATFDQVIADADLLLYDLKHYDAEKHLAGTGVENAQILQNLRHAIASGKDILTRIPVIPGYNDALEDAEGFLALLLSLGIRRLQLLPFHQFGEGKYDRLGLDYAYTGANSLHPEILTAYQNAFTQAGIDCFF